MESREFEYSANVVFQRIKDGIERAKNCGECHFVYYINERDFVNTHDLDLVVKYFKSQGVEAYWEHCIDKCAFILIFKWNAEIEHERVEESTNET